MDHNEDFPRRKVLNHFMGQLIASIHLRDSIARRIKSLANVSALLHLEDARYGAVDSFDDDEELLQKVCLSARSYIRLDKRPMRIFALSRREKKRKRRESEDLYLDFYAERYKGKRKKTRVKRTKVMKKF